MFVVPASHQPRKEYSVQIETKRSSETQQAQDTSQNRHKLRKHDSYEIQIVFRFYSIHAPHTVMFMRQTNGNKTDIQMVVIAYLRNLLITAADHPLNHLIPAKSY